MIYIDKETKKRVNIYAPYKDRSNLSTNDVRMAVGVIEIEDDVPPEDFYNSPESYFVTEDWETSTRPYTIYTLKNPEQLQEIKTTKAKQHRQSLVDSLVVTTTSGKSFDGDEVSQDRIAKAIQVAEITGLTECEWVLANNIPTLVTLDELKEALVKSFVAMGAVWSSPYKDES